MSIKDKFEIPKEEPFLGKKSKSLIKRVGYTFLLINALEFASTGIMLMNGYNRESVEKEIVSIKKDGILGKCWYYALDYPGQYGKELVYTLTGGK